MRDPRPIGHRPDLRATRRFRRPLALWRRSHGNGIPDTAPIPDLAIVAEVVRLAESAEAERYDQRPAEYPMYRADDLDQFFQPTPAWDTLVAHLRGLPDESVAGLYGLLPTR